MPSEIKDLPDDERKSVMLAKAMGLDVWHDKRMFLGKVLSDDWVIGYKDEEGYYCTTIDFYGDHMEVTWMVVNWAFSYPMDDDDGYQFVARLNMIMDFGELLRLPANKAQRIMLDKIFFLATKDGIIKVDE